MNTLKRIWCLLTLRHDIRLEGDDADETLHYRCRRCGLVWPYYF